MYIAPIYTGTTMFCLHICDFNDNVLTNEIIPQEMDFYNVYNFIHQGVFRAEVLIL